MSTQQHIVRELQDLRQGWPRPTVWGLLTTSGDGVLDMLTCTAVRAFLIWGWIWKVCIVWGPVEVGVAWAKFMTGLWKHQITHTAGDRLVGQPVPGDPDWVYPGLAPAWYDTSTRIEAGYTYATTLLVIATFGCFLILYTAYVSARDAKKGRALAIGVTVAGWIRHR